MPKKRFFTTCLLAMTLAIAACAHPCADNGKTAETQKMQQPLAEKIVADEPPDYLPEQAPRQPAPATREGTP